MINIISLIIKLFYLLQGNFILREMHNRVFDLVAKWWMSVDNLNKIMFKKS